MPSPTVVSPTATDDLASPAATDEPAPSTPVEPTETIPPVSPTPPPTVTEASDSSATPAPTASERATGVPAALCALGSGLRRDTTELQVAYPAAGRFVMVSSAGPAKEFFGQLEGGLRVLVAPSLAQLELLAERADQSGVPYDALGYGLEQGRHTTADELADLVGATQQAADLADKYGKRLVVGPGFKLMSEHWSDYSPMAANADVWILQSQRLQVHPPGPTYREEVEKVVNEIRAGNPDIEIWVQISVTPGPTTLSVEEWLAYRDSIIDLVEGVYVFDARDPNRPETLEAIFDAVCGTTAPSGGGNSEP